MIDIKKKTAELIKENVDIPEEVTQVLFDIGVLDVHVCKKALIRDEYHKCSRWKLKSELKIELSEKYCISVSSIDKYLAEEKNL